LQDSNRTRQKIKAVFAFYPGQPICWRVNNYGSNY
jgi:hypothetical protein